MAKTLANCGGLVIDNITLIDENGVLKVKLSGTTTYENIIITGDLVVDSVDVETSITIPTPSDASDAANKGYVDAHYITSPDNTLYQIKVANDGTLSTEAVV